MVKESFKSTSGAAQSLESGQFLQTSTAFYKREIMDVQVKNIPPGKMLILQQMMFDCDGTVIKLPHIETLDGKSVFSEVRYN